MTGGGHRDRETCLAIPTFARSAAPGSRSRSRRDRGWAISSSRPITCEGLRRARADRRSLVQAAARRHRRRDRPERRWQDHAVPDDRRAGEGRRRRALDRRHDGDRLCRADTRHAGSEAHGLGGRLGRRRSVHGGRPHDAVARVRRVVRVPRDRPAEAGGGAVGRRAQPAHAREDAAQRSEPPAAGRADEQPRCRHAAGGRSRTRCSSSPAAWS
jgi:hypothetical protein